LFEGSETVRLYWLTHGRLTAARNKYNIFVRKSVEELPFGSLRRRPIYMEMVCYNGNCLSLHIISVFFRPVSIPARLSKGTVFWCPLYFGFETETELEGGANDFFGGEEETRHAL
jgi:hypothetical protein